MQFGRLAFFSTLLLLLVSLATLAQINPSKKLKPYFPELPQPEIPSLSPNTHYEIFPFEKLNNPERIAAAKVKVALQYSRYIKADDKSTEADTIPNIYTFNKAGYLTGRRKFNGESNSHSSRKIILDSLNRIQKVVGTYEGDTAKLLQHNLYSEEGKLVYHLALKNPVRYTWKDNRIISKARHFYNFQTEDNSLETKHFTYNPNGLITVIDTYTDSVLSHKEFFTYTTTNKLLKHITEDYFSHQSSVEDYKYDAQGRIIEEIKYNNEGKVSARYEWVYSKNGRKIAWRRYDYGRLFSTAIYTFNKNNSVRKVVENKHIVKQRSIHWRFTGRSKIRGKFYSKTKIKYNSSGDIVKWKRYSAPYHLSTTYRYRYNDKDLLIETRRKNDYSVASTTYTYLYHK